MREKRRARKQNRKIVILIILSLIIFLILMLLIYLDYRKKEEQKAYQSKIYQNIKNSYNEKVITLKNSSLYEKEKNSYKKIGLISKDYVLELENKKIKNYKDEYFKIKDKDYYINYKSVKPTKEDKKKDNYVYLKYGKKLITKDKFALIKDDKEIYLFDKSMQFDAIVNDKDYYKVLYDDLLYEIKKDDIKEEKEDKVEEEATNISVIYYEKLFDESKEKCTNENCVKLAFFKDNMKMLEDNSYVSLSIEDYVLWRDKKVKLPKKSILVLGKNIDDNLKSLTKINLNEYDEKINFVNNNNQSSLEEEKPSMYKIINKTTIELFKSAMEGKTISYIPSQGYASGQGIAVLNYHFFYNPDAGEKCDEAICEPVSLFRQHLDYLKSEGFKTLSMQEFKSWMYGEIELPKKSVLITVDDGAFGTDTHLPKILDEYNMKATLFLITAWWEKSKYVSPNLDIQSHGYNIHESGSCGQAKALCLSKSSLTEDLKKSIPLVDNDLSIAYPFYKYNSNVIESVKEAGFKLAFAGGQTKAYRTSNKYAIPRYEIFNTTSLSTIKNYVN